MRRLVLLLVLFVLAACGGSPAASITPEDILSKFKAAGLEAESPTTMDAKAYGMAPDGVGHITFNIGGATSGYTVVVDGSINGVPFATNFTP